MAIDNAAPTGVTDGETNERSKTTTPKQLPPEFYQYFLSDAAKERKPSPIRGLYPLEKKPGVISLLAGKPNDAMFPFESLSFTITDPSHSSQSIPISITGTDLAAGLQYGPTAGLPRLNEWFVGLQELAHGRKPSEGWRLTIGNGSQDVICKAINAIMNPGDPILIEAPVYAGVLPILSSLHCELVEVATDENGVCSSDLRSILETWPAGRPKPKAFYTVPYGCNPTGMTATIERRREVLQLAREYNFLILEDDPYYYLYFGKDVRPPSYFKLELETPEVGRVVRFDSFSKILSAGMRMGFASGPNPIIDVMDLHTSFANLQGSSLVQAITLALVEKWGYDGFFTHTEAVAEFYREKRDTFEKALQTHLGDLAEWKTPEAGMFFWFKLLINANPHDEGDSKELIQTKAYENGVLALPGTVFLPNGRKTAYVRAAFSLSTEEQVNEALRRLKEVLDLEGATHHITM
ncbi:PLP-dependent transferase [Imleria badia]|nr:PLP-dependent transferase [Imleria badia]